MNYRSLQPLLGQDAVNWTKNNMLGCWSFSFASCSSVIVAKGNRPESFVLAFLTTLSSIRRNDDDVIYKRETVFFLPLPFSGKKRKDFEIGPFEFDQNFFHTLTCFLVMSYENVERFLRIVKAVKKGAMKCQII